MGHTNSTTNYSLPQFTSTDKPAWLTDVNSAYSAIDTAIKNAQDAGDNAQGDATQALSDAGDALTAANTADGKGSGAVASIAEAFDATSTYPVGELVMYNNLLYKCTTAVTTPGAWTGVTNWTRCTVDDLIQVLMSKVLDNLDLTGLAANQIIVRNSNNDGWIVTAQNYNNLVNRPTIPQIARKNITLSSNSYVSPFLTYGNVSLSDLAGHTIVGYIPNVPQSTNAVCCCISGGSLHAYGSKAETITVDLIYI